MLANMNIKPISDAKTHENDTKVTDLRAEIYNIFGTIIKVEISYDDKKMSFI